MKNPKEIFLWTMVALAGVALGNLIFFIATNV